MRKIHLLKKLLKLYKSVYFQIYNNHSPSLSDIFNILYQSDTYAGVCYPIRRITGRNPSLHSYTPQWVKKYFNASFGIYWGAVPISFRNKPDILEALQIRIDNIITEIESGDHPYTRVTSKNF